MPRRRPTFGSAVFNLKEERPDGDEAKSEPDGPASQYMSELVQGNRDHERQEKEDTDKVCGGISGIFGGVRRLDEQSGEDYARNETEDHSADSFADGSRPHARIEDRSGDSGGRT